MGDRAMWPSASVATVSGVALGASVVAVARLSALFVVSARVSGLWIGASALAGYGLGLTLGLVSSRKLGRRAFASALCLVVGSAWLLLSAPAASPVPWYGSLDHSSELDPTSIALSMLAGGLVRCTALGSAVGAAVALSPQPNHRLLSLGVLPAAGALAGGLAAIALAPVVGLIALLHACAAFLLAGSIVMVLTSRPLSPRLVGGSALGAILVVTGAAAVGHTGEATDAADSELVYVYDSRMTPEARSHRDRLLDQARRQCGSAMCSGALVELEDFFEHNDDIGSIAPNLGDHPGVQTIYHRLLEIRSRPNVSSVLVELEVEWPKAYPEGEWPFASQVHVLTTASPETVDEWMVGLDSDEAVVNEPPVADVPAGYRDVVVWWD